MGGDRIVGRALEDVKVFGLADDHGDRLDGGRPGADDADAKAREVDLLVRPQPGVVVRTGKAFEALDLRPVGNRQTAGRHHAVSADGGDSVVVRERPARRRLIIARRLDPRVEDDVATQIEAVRHVLGIGQDFRLRRVALGPLPFLLKLVRELIGILQALDIAAGAGIAVPIPCAADTIRGFEGARRYPHLAQPI